MKARFNIPVIKLFEGILKFTPSMHSDTRVLVTIMHIISYKSPKDHKSDLNGKKIGASLHNFHEFLQVIRISIVAILEVALIVNEIPSNMLMDESSNTVVLIKFVRKILL
jgi:hypothetical protein